MREFARHGGPESVGGAQHARATTHRRGTVGVDFNHILSGARPRACHRRDQRLVERYAVGVGRRATRKQPDRGQSTRTVTVPCAPGP